MPGAMARNNCGSGPMPNGKRLTTITKKKSVASTSARRRHARIKSRRTSHENIVSVEALFTIRDPTADWKARRALDEWRLSPFRLGSNDRLRLCGLTRRQHYRSKPEL